MAAVLGLNMAEATNTACCARRSVRDSNGAYLELLRQTGLPSLEEMACTDATAQIRQIIEIKPHWFDFPNTTRTRHGNRRFLANNVSAAGCNGKTKTLLHEILELHKKDIRDYIPEKTERKNKWEKLKDITKELRDIVTVTDEDEKKKKWLAAEFDELAAECEPPFATNLRSLRKHCVDETGATNYSHLLRSHTLASRYTFNCLDAEERVRRRKTQFKIVSDGRSKRIGSPDNNTQDGFDLINERTPKKTKMAHPKTRSPTKRFRDPISPYKIIKDRSQSKKAVTVEWKGNKPFCRFCGQKLDFNLDGAENDSHLLFSCKGLKSEPLNSRENKNSVRFQKKLMKRIAEIGAPPDPGGNI